MRPRTPFEIAIDKACGYDPSNPSATPPKPRPSEPPNEYVAAINDVFDALEDHYSMPDRVKEARLFRCWEKVREMEAKQ